MSFDDQHIKLDLDTNGVTAGAKQAEAALDGVKESADGAAEALAAMTPEEAKLNAERSAAVAALMKEEAATYAVAKAVGVSGEAAQATAHKEYNLADAERVAAAEAAKLAAAERAAMHDLDALGIRVGQNSTIMATASNRHINYNQAVIQGSYAIQDFSAVNGDLGQRLNSVSNNLQMVTNMLGPWGIAVGIGASVGIALYRSWDDIIRGFQHKEPIDEAGLSLDALTKIAHKNTEELDKLREKQTLTNTEMTRYNELLKITLQEEAELEAKRAAASSKKAPSEAESEASKMSKAVRDKVGGKQFESDVRAAMKAASPGMDAANLQKNVEGFVQQFLAGNEKATEYMRANPRAFGETGMAQEQILAAPGDKAAADRRKAAKAETARQEKLAADRAEAFDAEAMAAYDAELKQEATDAKKQKAAGQKELNEGVAAEARKRKALEDTLKGTTLDEEAARAAAMYRARGGDKGVQEGRLASDITREIGRRMPGVGKDQAEEIGTRWAAEQMQNVDQKISQAEAQIRGEVQQQANAMGVSVQDVLGVTTKGQANTAVAMQALQTVLATTGGLLQAAQAQAQGLARLSRDAASQNKQLMQLNRTQQNMGAPGG